MAYKTKAAKTVPTAARTPAVEALDASQAARAIVKDGYVTGLRLKPAVLDELQNLSTTAKCFGEEDFKVPFYAEDRAAAEQRYGRKLKVGRLTIYCKHLPPCSASLQIQPYAPSHAATWARTSVVGRAHVVELRLGNRCRAATLARSGFHYDIDGYRALAFFFYLTKVTPLNGAHICVRGSHMQKPLKALLSLHKSRGDDEIAEWYGAERQIVLCGAAGDGFAEDIFCFHKGLAS